MMPTPHDRTRIAAAAAVYVRTVDRAYSGRTIRSTVRARIVEAARNLGLPPPPDAAVADKAAPDGSQP